MKKNIKVNPIKKLKKLNDKRKSSLRISKKQSKQTYNFNTYKVNKDIKVEIEKRYNILNVIIILALLILVTSLFVVQVVGKEKYQTELENLTKTVIYGETAPRGRIYDRNGKLIVDNIPSKVIYYKKPSGVTSKEEIKIAYKLAGMIDLDYSKLNDYDFRNFWIKNNPKKAKAKITDEDGGEWDVNAAVVPSAYEGRFSSTLEGDKEVNLEGSEVTALYYGTNRYQGCNLPVWFIHYETADNEILQFEFVAPSGSTFASGFPTGTFTAATNALNANTFVPGFSQSGYLYASWYMTIVNETQQGYQVGDPMASLVGGTVEITKDGDNYTVKVNAQDDIPYNITAEWTGTINAQDASQQMAPARITCVPDSRISLEYVTDNLFRK